MIIGPLDLFDTLAQTDWSGRFESFDEDDMRDLRLYAKLAGELGRRPFFASPQRLSFKASAAESYQRFDPAGDDALRSMAVNSRQLVMEGNPAEFKRVRSLLRNHAANTPAG